MDLQHARALAIDLATPGQAESVLLREAPGRVLAQTVAADRSIPREARSRWDGFAICSSDTFPATPQQPVSLEILSGMLAAGHLPDRELTPGCCLRILTGAPLPPRADAVVPQEAASEADGRLSLERAHSAGSGVILPGAEIGEGECLLPRGAILTPTRCALLASLGREKVSVHRRPRVALLATGDEVRELGELAEGPFTFCNNRYLLEWLTVQQGGETLNLGRVGDDPQVIAERLRGIKADVVITPGGMGRGNRDFILEVWQALGIQEHFCRIDLSPGRNSALGSKGRQIFWGLPGNPWGAQLVFQELVAPVLRRLGGHTRLEAPGIRALLRTPLKKKKGGTQAVRGVLDLETIPPSFLPTERTAGALFADLRDSFAYMLLDARVLEVAAGNEVRVFLHDLPTLAHPLLVRAECVP